MTPQTFSLGMCRLLSSLAPEFEGHYAHYRTIYFRPEDPKIEIRHEDWVGCRIRPMGKAVPGIVTAIICPAWQVEDVLRNLKILAPYVKHQDPVPVEIFFKPKVALQEYTICCNHGIKEYALPWEIMVSELTSLLVMDPETAYQKIEEYLWSFLK